MGFIGRYQLAAHLAHHGGVWYGSGGGSKVAGTRSIVRGRELEQTLEAELRATGQVPVIKSGRFIERAPQSVESL